MHQTLVQLTRDLEEYQFNTIVSGLMELLNSMQDAAKEGAVGSSEWDEAVDYYLRMLAPVTPHIAEELWHRLDREGSVHEASWPEVDEEALEEDEITLVVQVNGKLRDKLTLPADVSQEAAEKAALASEGAQKFTEGKTVRKVIYVPGRLVNIVAN